MAAVQGLLKKHDAFETDFAAHRDRCADICSAGAQLTEAHNHHSDSIAQRCHQLQVHLLASLSTEYLYYTYENLYYIHEETKRNEG